MRTIPAGLVAVILTLGVVAACGGDDDGTVASPSTTSTTAAGAAATSTVSVTASGFKFSPDTATATAGTVHFEVKNEDSTNHTFTITGTKVDLHVDGSGTAEGDADLAAGSYEWHCSIHPSMKGTLTVS
jgi:plastocyanin